MTLPENIPTKAQWEPFRKGDLDYECAYKHFLGKSFSEAVELFAKNALIYQEDLCSMPPVPFRFYTLAFIKYLLSEKSRNDSDGASTFLKLVRWKLEKDCDSIAPIMDEALSCAQHIALNQEFYDASVDIYGKFSEEFESIMKIWNKPKI